MTGTSNALEGSGAMFDAIAERYDFVNRIISLGIDQRWRRATARSLSLGANATVLDLATGTSDLAIQVVREFPGAHVTGIDPSTRMLQYGAQKLVRLGLSERISLELGNAEELRFPDRSVDGVCIAFGIRNVPDRARALREMARVTRQGGRIAILELSEPRGQLLGALARLHVHTIVPWLGAVLSGAREYRYLQRSIAAFPAAEEFTAQLREAGITPVAVEPLTFGVCHLYVGTPTTSR
jgi:demethylmenaquinone methyltransferase / 2-methoxy-6-polyprenyl-1,4-benzoquinol methylase